MTAWDAIQAGIDAACSAGASKEPGTYEIVDGIAYLYDADGAFAMMMPEKAFREMRSGQAPEEEG